MQALFNNTGIVRHANPLEKRVTRDDQYSLPSSDPISILQTHLRQVHGCESIHLARTYVEERHPSGSLWRQDVHTFQLSNADNGRCYGWIDQEQEKPVSVCENESVIGPASAVRSSFAHSLSQA